MFGNMISKLLLYFFKIKPETKLSFMNNLDSECPEK